ncbi:MAG: GDSL-type esterase/lipase family protein [Myxococcota bacterium]
MSAHDHTDGSTRPGPPGGEEAADAGLLDGEERAHDLVALRGEGADPGPYATGTFQKIAQGMVALVALVVAPYLVPGLDASLAERFEICKSQPRQGDDCSFARAWLPGEPVPFWNVIGRELLGEGAAEVAAETEVAKAEALATALLEQDDADDQPLPPREVIPEPPPTVADPEGPPPLPVYVRHADDATEVVQSLELPTANALDPFFEALARTDAGYAGAITRISQWGDSVIASDNVTSSARASMQRRFGDAGHGFHLLAKPNASYKHRGIRFTAKDWQLCYVINKCRSDKHFGFGGTTVWSGGGGETVFRTTDSEALGGAWSRVEIWYASQPDGGKLRLKLDGGPPTFVSTRGEALADQWHTLSMTDGPHTLKIRADGRARLYGAVFEREGPGVVWDGMEQLGAFTSRMLYFDEAHLRSQVEHRDPDLMVFMFGGNDLTLSAAKVEKYEATWRATLARFRGDPGNADARPCLLIAPVDHGQRKGPRIISRPEVAEIVKRQRLAAAAAGCAFFDTPAAMGGEGAAGRWRKADKPLIAGDLAHLTLAGQKVIGHYVYLALMEQYVAYRKRTDAR